MFSNTIIINTNGSITSIIITIYIDVVVKKKCSTFLIRNLLAILLPTSSADRNSFNPDPDPVLPALVIVCRQISVNLSIVHLL